MKQILKTIIADFHSRQLPAPADSRRHNRFSGADSERHRDQNGGGMVVGIRAKVRGARFKMQAARSKNIKRVALRVSKQTCSQSHWKAEYRGQDN